MGKDTERKTAEKWLRAHEAELPSMTDGAGETIVEDTERYRRRALASSGPEGLEQERNLLPEPIPESAPSENPASPYAAVILAGLTRTQEEVVCLTLEGQNQKQIARALKISQPAVSKALKAATAKMTAARRNSEPQR